MLFKDLHNAGFMHEHDQHGLPLFLVRLACQLPTSKGICSIAVYECSQEPLMLWALSCITSAPLSLTE